MVSAEYIGERIRAFWLAYCGKSSASMEEMYFPTALVFSPFTQRSESARLMLARRLRKFSGSHSSVTAELGPIDVQLAGEIAIASYTYQFRLLRTNPDGSRLDFYVPYSRATQVFQADQGGAWRILHEHLSVSEPGKKTLIPREDHSSLNANHKGLTAEQKFGSLHAPVRSLEMGPILDSRPVSAEEVQHAIHKSWRALQSKSIGELEAGFLPTGIFFGADARRSEPARLAIMRRAREFFSAGCSVHADLGPIEAQTAGSGVALGAYTFQFQMVRQQSNGTRVKMVTPLCRSSVVLVRDETGALRILHEHQSAIEVGRREEIDSQRPAIRESTTSH
jgi:ketosteroid isomerase-like protein